MLYNNRLDSLCAYLWVSFTIISGVVIIFGSVLTIMTFGSGDHSNDTVIGAWYSGLVAGFIGTVILGFSIHEMYKLCCTSKTDTSEDSFGVPYAASHDESFV